MKPKYETTGRSLGRPSAAFACSGSPGRNRVRSTEFGTTVDPTPKTPATSWLIAIDAVASPRIAERTSSERRSPPPSGRAERRCHTTGSESRRASHAAGISGESLKWTSSKRCLRSVRRKRSTCGGRSPSSRRKRSQRLPRQAEAQMCVKAATGPVCQRPMLAAVMALNVLHISESAAAGGAARTEYKVHRGIKEQGHVSRMLVGRKVPADDDIRRIKRHDGWRAADRICSEVLDRL